MAELQKKKKKKKKKNIEYILCAEYSTKLKQLKSNTNFTLYPTHGRAFTTQSVNVGMLKKTTHCTRFDMI